MLKCLECLKSHFSYYIFIIQCGLGKIKIRLILSYAIKKIAFLKPWECKLRFYKNIIQCSGGDGHPGGYSVENTVREGWTRHCGNIKESATRSSWEGREGFWGDDFWMGIKGRGWRQNDSGKMNSTWTPRNLKLHEKPRLIHQYFTVASDGDEVCWGQVVKGFVCHELYQYRIFQGPSLLPSMWEVSDYAERR